MSVNDSIIVYDDMFTHVENHHYYGIARNASYINNNVDTFDTAISPIEYKWVCRFTADYIQEVNLVEKYRERLSCLQKYRQIKVISQYINYSSADTLDLEHIDDASMEKDDHITFLHYACIEWHPNWYGETLFYNDKLTEIEKAIIPRPGRVVVFDSRIRHSARPPSRLSPYSRYVYVTKLKAEMK